MRCNICNSVVTGKNIGYIKIPFENEGEKIVECKKCHSGRTRRSRKIRKSWLLNS